MRLAACALVFLLTTACGRGDDRPAESTREGPKLYASSCAACHGTDLKGSETGPPFLNPIYAPNHHPDEAFHRAVSDGVQPHHWEFGAMPAQSHLSHEDVEAIIAYVRSEQRETGITRDPSH